MYTYVQKYEIRGPTLLRKRIGALLIGQSPRPDLLEPLSPYRKSIEIIQVGALDDLEVNELPFISQPCYPLETRMRNGESVTVEQEMLAPLLQKAVHTIEQMDVCAVMLMCAGTFPSLRCRPPLFRPFQIGLSFLRAVSATSIGVLAPIEEQMSPIRARWQDAGFNTMIWSADLHFAGRILWEQINEEAETNDLEYLVLDYVGHSRAAVRQIQQAVSLPVLDLGSLAAVVLASTI